MFSFTDLGELTNVLGGNIDFRKDGIFQSKFAYLISDSDENPSGLETDGVRFYSVTSTVRQRNRSESTRHLYDEG